MSLHRIFQSEVSSSAFQVVDGETRIVGKFAQISLMEKGVFDIWLVGLGLHPLSTRKLNSIIKMFPQGVEFRVLTGEAYAQVRDKGVVLESLSLLGIRRKRKLSPVTREKLILRLKTARDVLPLVAATYSGINNDEYQGKGSS
jgi:hypothetical protein